MDIVIHCPGDCHKKPRLNKATGKIEVVPKILLVADCKSQGVFKVQCNDSVCRRTGATRGWHKITLKAGGSPMVEPMNMYKDGHYQKMKLLSVPVAVVGGD